MALLATQLLFVFAYFGYLLFPVYASDQTFPSIGPLAIRNGIRNSTNNSTTSTNSTVPACKFPLNEFRTQLSATCRSEIEAIQACPTSAMSSKQRREVAKRFSSCAVKIYRKVSSCAVYTVPKYNLPPFESDDRLGLMADYLNPFSNTLFGKRANQEHQACKNPDILPILERSIAPFLNDTDGKWLAVEKTPHQYVRCVLQAPESTVESCVRTSVRKLQYLPNRLIVYGGQKTCNTQFHLLFQTIQKMILETLHFVFEVWRSRRKRKEDPEDYCSFSWVGFFRAVIVGIGTSIICALIIRTQFPEHSIAAALGLYFLLPQAAPFIAFLSGMFLSKGFGTQTLLVDLVTAGAALVLYNMRFTLWSGPPVDILPVDGLPNRTFLYMGIYLATVPAGVVFFIYQGIVLLAVGLLIWSIFAKSKGLAQAAGWLIGLWITMWIAIVSFAVFAIAEIIWLATTGHRKKDTTGIHYVKRFPGLLSVRTFFYEGGWGCFLRTWGYWAWVLVSFGTAAGRWMFILELLKLTGPAFCPDALKGATAAGFLIPFAAFGANILLKLYGLAL